MRRLLIGAALGAAFCFSGPACAEEPPGAEPPTCRPPAALQASLLQRQPTLRLARRLEGEAARIFAAGFNALPPRSDYPADAVLFFVAPSRPGTVRRAVLVALFEAGCLSGGGLLPETLALRLLALSGQSL